MTFGDRKGGRVANPVASGFVREPERKDQINVPFPQSEPGAIDPQALLKRFWDVVDGVDEIGRQ
jgi:hypothetical protein